MPNFLKLYGIKTNNLKNIDVNVTKGTVIGIAGISGGGKSSLAYDTIHALCKQEFTSIEEGFSGEGNYIVNYAEGVSPSAAIRQKNKNTNPRSTIYTYLNISSYIFPLISEASLEPSALKINRPDNMCQSCMGIGYLNGISYEMVVDESKSIKENPFLPWIGDEKKEKLLWDYCGDIGVSEKSKFYDLSDEVKNKLLYGLSERQYQINFKNLGKSRKRRLHYQGVVKELESFLDSGKVSLVNKAEKFSNKIVCSACSGSRINVEKYRDFKILGLPFREFLLCEISKLKKLLAQKCSSKTPSLGQLERLIEAVDEVGLGYLSFSRSIPSLSGGELQKINFSKLSSSIISNIIIVLDEISSQVNVEDYGIIIKRIEGLRDSGNTIVLVEHNKIFLSKCEAIIEIGPVAGMDGGYVVTSGKGEDLFKDEFLENSQEQYRKYYDKKNNDMPEKWINFHNIKNNNVDLKSLDVPKGRVTALVGPSGSGKSSLATFLSDKFDEIELVTQSFIQANVRSSVMSYLGLTDCIADFYGKYFSQTASFFHPGNGKQGACSNCNGSGMVQYDLGFEGSRYACCPVCDGMLFSGSLNDFKIEDVDIISLCSKEVSKINLFVFSVHRLKKAISIMKKLGLGHISLNRKTNSLSGGEARRLKLAKLFMRRVNDKILVIDEPGAGLDDETANNVMNTIIGYKDHCNAIIIIDHKPVVYLNADYLIEFGPGSGLEGGRVVFEGSPIKYFENSYLPQVKKII